MRLSRLLLGRLAAFVVSLLVASLAVFLLLNLLPGDVTAVILGNNATPAAVAHLRSAMGLDDPVLLRYVHWLAGVAHGNLGASAFTGEPVAGLIVPKLAVTISLVGGGMVLAMVLALPAGLFAALHRRQASGQMVLATSQLGMAVPAFLAGIVLVVVFAARLRWLPAGNYVPLTSDPLDWFRHLILPWVSLALVQGAVLVRYVRGAFLDVMDQDYMRTARSIGWRRRRAVWRHGLRNAALQIVTVLGLQLATLFVGAVVIENVFVLPGLGSLLLRSVNGRDLPLVQAIVLVLVALILMINLLVDVAYLVIDPRLRTGRAVVE
ncbi:MAG: ABC transporter permease [Actinomycetia bacterium]|nr:ABC transporter permease [Actinomycetes bacterium]